MTELTDEEQQILSNLEEKSITFSSPLPGLSPYTRYILHREEAEFPFFTLRCVENPSLCLSVVEPQALVPDYAGEVDDAVLSTIDSPAPEDMAVLVVIIIQQDPTSRKINIKANLVSPIVLNKKSRQGCQVALKNPPANYSDSSEFNF